MNEPATGPRPVLIIGIGCRIPGAAGVGQLWRLLTAGHDATRALPPGRTGYRRGGYLDGLDGFDNDWFTISDREAAVMDPQQRLSLEVAVEAVDDAGVGYRLRGSNAAVLFGASSYDHGTVVLGRGSRDAPYAVTGSALSIIANRLSYALDLHGPSLVLDSACSSSLAAVDLAVRLLSDDTVPLAIVGGVNLTLLPHISDYLDRGGFLAADGRCKPFDAAADGYTRSDGCTVLILQRSADARRERNRVYAEIVGAAVGSDGRSNGLFAPNGRAQQQVLRTAWARAGITPRAAGLFECHGTGTALGDAVEIGALAAVLGEDEPPDPAVWIGSVKSNVGHLEAAAGVTGLAKAALCVRAGIIAPTVHFRSAHPLLKLAERGLRVATEPVGWEEPSPDRRYAGVSSFGFGGTNAHVVLRGAPHPVAERTGTPPWVIPISARDDAQLRGLAREWAEVLAEEAPPLREFAAAAARLLPERVRAAILAHDTDEAVARLRELGDPAHADAAPPMVDAPQHEPPPGADDSGHTRPTGTPLFGPVAARRPGGVLLLFSGQGGQHPRMGRALAARYPEFAEAVATATDAVVAAGGPRVWTPRHGFAHSLGSTDEVQPALFVYQIALAELLRTWGIRIDGVAGHSLGEVAAAVTAGALSLPAGARVVVARSGTLARLDGRGAMAMVEGSRDEVGRLVEPMRADVGVAAVNGPRAVVVSGVARYVDTVVRRARRRGLFAQPIAVDFAAHSPQVRELLPELRTRFGIIAARSPVIPIYSTTRPGPALTGAVTTADYWAENASGTVELAAALDRAADDGLSTVLECGPHPVLNAAVADHPEFADAAYPLAHRDDEPTAFLTALARLQVAGGSVNWSAQGPFRDPAPGRRWHRNRFALLVDSPPDPIRDDPSDHLVAGVPTVPAMFWLRQLSALVAGRTSRLVDFAIHDRTDVAALPDVGYRVEADTVLAHGPIALATARIGTPPGAAEIVGWMRIVDAHRGGLHDGLAVAPDAYYARLRDCGLDYGPRFRPLRRIVTGHRSAIGLFGHAPIDTATLDGCLQLIAAAAGEVLPPDVLPLPVAIDSAWISDTPDLLLTEAHAFLRETESEGLSCDVLATDQHGAPAVALLGIRVRFADRPSPPGLPYRHVEVERDQERTAFTVPEAVPVLRAEQWEPIDPPARPRQPIVDRVLVVGESTAAVALTRALNPLLPAVRVARDPDAAAPLLAAALTGRRDRTAVVVVWPHPSDSDPTVTAVTRALALLQCLQQRAEATAVTIVLRDRTSLSHNGIAGLFRSLQLESGRPLRLVWLADDDLGALPDLLLAPDDPGEVSISGTRLTRRRFRPVTVTEPPIEISAEGTYVVTGGLGALGAVAVRWLLAAGAHDVVVLTRRPRPLPPLLEGLEDRIVLVRCDVTDRDDLATALHDIRECGSVIRGLVHSAGALRDAEFSSVTTELVTELFEPKVGAAAALLDLTATDPVDFTVLFSSATGALGAPGQAAYAAANAALDALAARAPRQVISIGWGSWVSGLAEAAGGAAHLRRAGIVPFDVRRGTAVLSAIPGRRESYLLALDYEASDDISPLADRLRDTVGRESASPPGPISAPTPRLPAPPSPASTESVAQIIRGALAFGLRRPVESIDPTDDFTELGLSSLLAIELRRTLEARLGIRIATGELFEYSTVTALDAVLSARIRATRDREEPP